MIDLPYSLGIEATEDPAFFGFHSPELVGSTGIGHSIEDGLYRARRACGSTSSCSASRACRYLLPPPIRP